MNTVPQRRPRAPSLDDALVAAILDIETSIGVAAPDVAPLWEPQEAQPGRGILLPDGRTVSPQQLAIESPADELFFGGAPGGGKALDVETPIPTPSGWRRMGDLVVGDTVFDDRGRQCEIVAASDVMLDHETYAVTFDDGETIVADADHRWLTTTRSERQAASRRTDEYRRSRRASRPPSRSGRKSTVFSETLSARNATREYAYLDPPRGAIRTTREIAVTVRRSDGGVNHCIAVAPAIECRGGSLPIDPYVLGVWLGDGTSHGGTVTTADAPILTALVSAGYEIGRSAGYGPLTCRVFGLQQQLRALGVLRNKHVPEPYLWASTDERLALLQGLMDTDGHCDHDGGASFTNTNERLADAVEHLFRSIGVKAFRREYRARLNGRDCGPAWCVKATTTTPLFRLARKAGRQATAARQTQARRYVTAVTRVDSRPVRCIAVDSPSRLYLAGRSMTPTHNSDLLLGLAVTRQRNSIIFRQQFTQFRGEGAMIERSREIIGLRGDLNEGTFLWRNLPGGRALQFAGVATAKDMLKWRGRPHDMKGFDELPEIPERVYRFLIGWLRTAVQGQRTRVVGTGNPPATEEGRWVLRYWGPWLDKAHPNPAKVGELRWFVVGEDGKDREVPGPAWGPERAPAVQIGGRWVSPRSRTFVLSQVEDNPVYVRTNYAEVLDALPEPYRSQMRFGDFSAGVADHEWQVIPTAWVRAAQARWTPEGGDGIPLTAIGNDPSRGGGDEFVVAKRHDAWVAPIEAHAGADVPDGFAGAAILFKALAGDQGVPIQIDIGGSAGSSVYDQARALGLRAVAMNGAAKSRARDRSGKLRFVNKRAEWHWKLREALDPDLGDDVALPPDPQMAADLCAARWFVTVRGIQIEDKDEIKKRIGRSPDRGEGVIYACAEPGGAAMELMAVGPSATALSDAEAELATLRARLGGRQNGDA